MKHLGRRVTTGTRTREQQTLNCYKLAGALRAPLAVCCQTAQLGRHTLGRALPATSCALMIQGTHTNAGWRDLAEEVSGA